MKNPNLTFNLLTFAHPHKELTFWFTNTQDENLCRIYHTLVPDEVKDNFGEQKHYYTSFEQKIDNFFPVTKNTTPDFNTLTNEEGEEHREMVKNSAFSISILKKYYNHKIHNYFRAKGFLVKPNFINDTEIWIPIDEKNDEYQFFEKYTLKVQLARITKKPEVLITYAGVSKVFHKSITDFMTLVSSTLFTWVVYGSNLYKFGKLPEEGRQNYEKVHPVWNFSLRDALKQPTKAPDKTNKYIKFRSHIDKFFNNYLNTDDFKAIIPIDSDTFVKIPEFKINHVKENSNELLFGEKYLDKVPFRGMLKGPFKAPKHKIQFFFILHKDDEDVAVSLNKFFDEGLYNFKGIYNFAKVPYFTQPSFSIVFTDKTNPLQQIKNKIGGRYFDTSIHYIAIYISPYNKHVKDRERRLLYYRVKELLLKKRITSQAIEAEKVRYAVQQNLRYDYSLNNIAIAILAKLNGIPWQLNTKLKNELIVGVGAFKNIDTNTQYIGSAFSFTNNGRFNRFECFQKNQTDELAGSIIRQIKDYVEVNNNINRLIIHFYKNMSNNELRPIEQGLNDLELDIPVFIISINKTESHDIVAFDNDWSDLMPLSGTFINVGFNRFLLFNNTRYSSNGIIRQSEGYPFPVKLSIRCTQTELASDYKTIKELIDQVYQFSRMYWKSVRQQHLPITIKYPEMVAEIFPHFEGKEIPVFGKDNLWFL